MPQSVRSKPMLSALGIKHKLTPIKSDVKDLKNKTRAKGSDKEKLNEYNVETSTVKKTIKNFSKLANRVSPSTLKDKKQTANISAESVIKITKTRYFEDTDDIKVAVLALPNHKLSQKILQSSNIPTKLHNDNSNQREGAVKIILQPKTQNIKSCIHANSEATKSERSIERAKSSYDLNRQTTSPIFGKTELTQIKKEKKLKEKKRSISTKTENDEKRLNESKPLTSLIDNGSNENLPAKESERLVCCYSYQKPSSPTTQCCNTFFKGEYPTRHKSSSNNHHCWHSRFAKKRTQLDRYLKTYSSQQSCHIPLQCHLLQQMQQQLGEERENEEDQKQHQSKPQIQLLKNSLQQLSQYELSQRNTQEYEQKQEHQLQLQQPQVDHQSLQALHQLQLQIQQPQESPSQQNQYTQQQQEQSLHRSRSDNQLLHGDNFKQLNAPYFDQQFQFKQQKQVNTGQQLAPRSSATTQDSTVQDKPDATEVEKKFQTQSMAVQNYCCDGNVDFNDNVEEFKQAANCTVTETHFLSIEENLTPTSPWKCIEPSYQDAMGSNNQQQFSTQTPQISQIAQTTHVSQIPTQYYPFQTVQTSYSTPMQPRMPISSQQVYLAMPVQQAPSYVAFVQQPQHLNKEFTPVAQQTYLVPQLSVQHQHQQIGQSKEQHFMTAGLQPPQSPQRNFLSVQQPKHLQQLTIQHPRQQTQPQTLSQNQPQTQPQFQQFPLAQEEQFFSLNRQIESTINDTNQLNCLGYSYQQQISQPPALLIPPTSQPGMQPSHASYGPNANGFSGFQNNSFICPGRYRQQCAQMRQRMPRFWPGY